MFGSMAQAHTCSREAVVPVYWTSWWLIHMDYDRARRRRCQRRAAFWAGLSVDLVGWGLQRQTPEGKEAWLLSMLGWRKERVWALETGEGKLCLSVSGAGEGPVLGPVGVGTTGRVLQGGAQDSMSHAGWNLIRELENSMRHPPWLLLAA